jgi:hypothetical protein
MGRRRSWYIMNEYQKYLIEKISYHSRTLEHLLHPTYFTENEQLWFETIHLHIKKIEDCADDLIQSLDYTQADYEVMQNDL